MLLLREARPQFFAARALWVYTSHISASDSKMVSCGACVRPPSSKIGQDEPLAPLVAPPPPPLPEYLIVKGAPAGRAMWRWPARAPRAG
jgi:hypothetical protein